ncbi:DNA-formamidopyrimidine glycosylase [Patescibacteria group bacterium]
MPELPEVETIVRELKPKVLKRTFVDVWTDWPKLIKKPVSFIRFKKEIRNKKIKNVWRRGKNIIFDLSCDKKMLIHQKMTGHLLYGKWEKTKNKWRSKIKGPLSEDPMNRFLHLIFFLDNKKQIALSDLRKFAKVELWEKRELEKTEGFNKLGPEPLDRSFTFKKFKEILPEKGKIKQILMDQSVIVGIGNIYADEILWDAKIHPKKDISKLTSNDFKKIYNTIPKILKKAIKFKGDSMSDYRRPNGEKGGYQNLQKVYRKEGKPCPIKNHGTIQRVKINGRSAHFCPKCQRL